MNKQLQLPIIKHRLPVVKYEGYKPSYEFSFSLVSLNKKERCQITSWHTCREELNREVLTKIYDDMDSLVDIDTLRILVKPPYDDYIDYKKNLFNARAALRLCEEHAGWTERSVISTVNHSQNIEAYLITGPGEWMSSPQMLSLAIHLIRLICFFGPADVDSWESFENWMSKNCDYNEVGREYDDDSSYEMDNNLKITITTNGTILKYISDILKHSTTLFKNNDSWCSEFIDGDGYVDGDFTDNSGIVSFLNSIKIKSGYNYGYLNKCVIPASAQFRELIKK